MGSSLIIQANELYSTVNDLNSAISQGDGKGIDQQIAQLSLISTGLGFTIEFAKIAKSPEAVAGLTGLKYQVDATLTGAALTQAMINIDQGNYSGAIANTLAAMSTATGLVALAVDKPGLSTALNGLSGFLGASSNVAEKGPQIADALANALSEIQKMQHDGTFPELDPGLMAGFAGEVLEGWSKEFYSWFPDDWNPWKNIDRNSDGVKKYHIYDPVVLDLDGDGIETIAANKWAGVLFDHDNDGIRTSTGWVGSDDGILVLDRNGDGVINDGSELFGDSVTLKDGSQASNGYAALAEFDSNGDGKVNAEDTNFEQLKVWRDLNQDGVSQTNELFGLTELGIQSLNLNHTNTDTALGNDNILAQTGSFETLDGQSHIMGDVNFSFNSIYSSFNNAIELTAEQQQAANLQGAGRVRDLREAAALSPELAETLKNYSNAETKAEQYDLLDQLILNWAKTDPDFKEANEVRMVSWVKTANEGIALTPGQAAIVTLAAPLSKESQAMLDKIHHILPILDAFSGSKPSQIYYENEADIKNVFNIINNAYVSLKEGIYTGLLYQTRLDDYLAEIELNLQATDPTELFNYSGIQEKLEQIFIINPEKAFTDLSDLVNYHPDILTNWLPEGKTLLIQFLNEVIEQGLWDDLASKVDLKILEQSGFIIGTKLDDTLNGTKNNDTLNGGWGNDKLNGGAGQDTLIGGSGNDVMTGGDYEKDIYIFQSGHGQDIINDKSYDWTNLQYFNDVKFEGANFTDAQFLRVGNDLVIKAFGTEDSVTFKNYLDQNDSYSRDFNFIFADKTVSTSEITGLTMQLNGTDGNDVLNGWKGKDVLIGGLGDDTLTGYTGDDLLDGGEGKNVLNGGDGNDTLITGSGNDVLNGDNGNDTLNGGAGNDTLNGGAGQDTLIGGSGNDVMTGGDYEKDIYIFQSGHGQDTINDKSYDWTNLQYFNDVKFEGANFTDAQFLRVGNDLVIKAFGTEDSVTFKNYLDQNDSYSRDFNFIFADKTVSTSEITGLTMQLNGTDGNDVLNGWKGKDVLIGGLGDDTLTGYTGDDLLDGGEGKNVLNGGDGNDTLITGSGNDVLNGDNGNDTLNGGAGNDTLNGGAGQDTLIGGSGNDVMTGGDYEKDIYIFQSGHGQDIINDKSYDWTNLQYFNDVKFEGANFTDAQFLRVGNDLVIKAFGTEDSVTFKNYLSDSDSYSRDFNFIFADKTASTTELTSLTIQLNGTDGNDVQNGWKGKDNLLGGLGDDTLNGLAGDDWLEGGEGNDTLNGGEGNDLLEGGAGNDKLTGGAGQDTLIGGSGNDVMTGGDYEKDIYIFQSGHGQDTINDKSYDWTNLQYFNDVKFEGANFTDAQFLRVGNDLVIKAFGTEDSVTFKNYLSDSDSYSRDFNFIFADKTASTTELTSLTIQLNGTDGNDVQNGWKGKDNLLGGLGDDTLNGLAGDDWLEGGAGNDILNGGEGNDLLEGGAGNDTLNGGAGQDTLIGGSGNDVMTGGDYEKDIYIFQSGHGQDTINDKSYDWTNLQYFNDVKFEGANFTDAQFLRVGNDLVIKAFGTEDSVTFKNYLSDSDSYSRDFNFIFADKTASTTELTSLTIQLNGTDGNDVQNGWKGKDNLLGGLGDDTLNGLAGDDWLEGGAGNDILNGGEGNDLLEGGAGNDTLNGGAGQDTLIGGSGNDVMTGGDYEKDIYIFQSGHGQDTINDKSYDWTNLQYFNDVKFEGANFTDAQFLRVGNDLVIKAFGTDDSVSFKNYLNDNDSYSRDFNFIFADKTLTTADVMNIVIPLNGTDGNDVQNGWKGKDNLLGSLGDDTLNGLAGDDWLEGGAGNDILNGGEGNDLLEGGAGNDTLNGGAGQDTLIGGSGNDVMTGGDYEKDIYIFQSGHGQDTINDKSYDWTNLQYFNDVKFEGANFTDAQFLRVGNDLVIKAFGTDDSVSFKNYLNDNDSYSRDFNFIFADKTLTTADVMNIVIPLNGTDGNDVQNGWKGKDNLLGSLGDDTLNGLAGDDWLEGGAGNDILNGGEGNDLLEGGAGNDTLTGGIGADTAIFKILAGFGNDATGGNGVDTWSDFNISQGDKINISELIIGPASKENLNQFVSFEKSGSTVTLSLDRDGNDINYSATKLLILNNQTNVNSLNDLIKADVFIV
ncbi:calcium-binding protein [Acinetobacter baumannii]|uniref:calcium-binding protein n=6 Tax=Acinetobacter baumannii TaxID=470 RepID=UPI0024B50879|nr:type I secretion C-terminal target domain-containing protein [Acinetobacter baumannii]MDI9254832.1 type I secretion C-terminal target domain-containing protein [Acinetobacter baumannii]